MIASPKVCTNYLNVRRNQVTDPDSGLLIALNVLGRDRWRRWRRRRREKFLLAEGQEFFDLIALPVVQEPTALDFARLFF